MKTFEISRTVGDHTVVLTHARRLTDAQAWIEWLADNWTLEKSVTFRVQQGGATLAELCAREHMRPLTSLT